jgi:predicted metal-dependent peptidase
MVAGEEAGVDMDSFDYGFYYLGMKLYGNMPLIEENEYRETMKVQELIIVLDTSASCQDFLVQEFLNETASMLLESDLFYSRVKIHILECDDKVQNDIVITSLEQMKEYARHFCLKGGFGTDFRPAFAYVEELRRSKIIGKPKGLMYFTDGKGRYPAKPTDYDTAFVFVADEDPDTSGVPNWAMQLFI